MENKNVKTYSIAFSADRDFSVPLGIAIYSLLLHAKPGRYFDIHVLDGGVTEQGKAMIEALKADYPCFNVTYWDLSNQFTDLPSNFRFTVATYYRLRLANLLPHVNRIFYTDADVLICDDLEELFQIDLGECYAGATQELSAAREGHEGLKAYREAFGVPDDGTPYYCAGQLLLDLDRIRQDGIEDRMMEKVYSVPPEVLGAPDQDIINSVMHGRIKTIPYKYGSIAFFEDRILRGSYLEDIGTCCAYTEEELKEAARHPVVIHYATAKPNILVGPRNRQESMFFDLWKASPWRHCVPYEPLKIREVANRTRPCVGKMLMLFPRLAIRCPRLLKLYGKLLSAGTRLVRTKS